MTFSKFRISYLALFVLSLAACKTTAPITPPKFDYDTLSTNFFNKASSDHFPLTVNRGASLHPVSLPSGFLFYTTNMDGSGDIWVRSMSNTINIPVVQHPTEQNYPALPQKGDRLVYVSHHIDSNGDLMILPIIPQTLIESALQGLPPVNYWDESQNLSTAINQHFADASLECQGEFSETNPVFSNDGRYLFYLSDRCSKGVNKIWVLELDDTTLLKKPVLIGSDRATHISLSHDLRHLVYIAPEKAGSIYIMDLEPDSWDTQPQRIRKIDLGETDFESQNRLISSPVFSSDGKYLFYQLVSDDTNQNGYLDLTDNASIYRITIGYTASGQIQAGAKMALVENTNSMVSMTYSTLVGGAIIYATNLYNSVNLYFMNANGVIPQKDTIDEQYQFAKKFLLENNQRYVIALDSVFHFFGNTPEYALYEGRIFFDKLDYYIKTNNKKQAIEIKKDIEAAKEQNSWINLDLVLNEKQFRSSTEKIQILNNYLQAMEKKTDLSEIIENADVEYAQALYLLALYQKESGRFDKSLESIRLLNAKFPEYNRRADALLHEAWLDSLVNASISSKYIDLVNDAKLSAKYSDRAHFELYQLLSSNAQLFDIDKERSRNDLPPIIKGTLDLFKATVLYKNLEYDNAIILSDSVLATIPHEVYRNRTRPLSQWNGLYVRLWQLKAKIHESRGNHTDAFFAKLSYGGSYNNESTAKLDMTEFLEIIDESDLVIQNYLQSARELSQFVENNVDANLQKNKVIDVIGLGLNPVVNIDSINRELLIEFCRPDTKNSQLFIALGGDHAKNYISFCSKNADQIRIDHGNNLKLETIRQASGLLYTGAYAYASLLNLLFFNMNQSRVFDSLYKSRAFYYHKLKIDIAREKQGNESLHSQKLIFIAGQEEALKLLREKDPFDSKIYDELEYGYSLTRDENIKVGDTAMLLGNAYLLITRAQEKEKYYHNFQELGGGLSAEFLRNKKEEILQDFKNAEYSLKYIINIDPGNAQSYLMLGWMYQYIDGQQEQSLKLEAGYLSSIYEYFTDSEWVVIDRNHYQDFYKTYFNFRFYETNIDLYKRYLDIYKPEDDLPFGLTSTYLNLGNNYFLLLNFTEAIKQYREVRKNIIKYSSQLLGSYQREALFYINFGRAYFYERKPLLASRHYKQAYRIYKENEYIPLSKKIEELENREKSNFDKLSEIEIIRLQKLKVSRSKTIKKLSLILALNGMADWDAGNYEDSIINYRTSLRNISVNDGIDHGIDKTSILNFLAMSYQGKGDYSQSDNYANLASNHSRDRFLLRDEEKYQPESIGGKLLSCFLDFGEDFSVVGEGRNPYGFSALRQFELSLGIQFQNRILGGDLDGAQYLMKQRKQVFLARDIDRSLGRNGFLSVLGQQGGNNYFTGDFSSAIENFSEASERAYVFNKTEKYKDNFANKYKMIFALFESILSGDEELEPDFQNKFEQYEKNIEEFREGFGEKFKEDYINQMQAESPDYEFDEKLDMPIINRLVVERLGEITEIQAILLMYKGLFLINFSKDLEKITKGYEYLRKSRAGFQDLTIFLQSRPIENYHHYLRLLLNQGRAALASQNYLEAKAIAQKVIEKSYEYNMLYEKFFAHYLLAESHFNAYQKDQLLSDRKLALEQIREANLIFINNTELFYNKSHFLKGFFLFSIDVYVHLHMKPEALLVMENFSEFELMQEYFKYPLDFERESLREMYNQLRSQIHLSREYYQDEISLRLARKQTAKLESRKLELKKSMQNLRVKYALKYPLHKPYVLFSENFKADQEVQKNQVIIRFLQIHNQASAYCIKNSGITFKTIPSASDYKQLLASCIEPQIDYKDVFIVPDKSSYEVDLYPELQKINPNNPRPVYITRLHDVKQGFINHADDLKSDHLNLFNVESVGELSLENYEQNQNDISTVSIEFHKNLPMFSSSEFRGFNVRKWVETQRDQSIVIINFKKEPGFGLYTDLYEAFRLMGVGTVVFSNDGSDKIKNELFASRGQARYSQARLYGFPGFVAKNIEPFILKKSIEKMLIGESLESRESFTSALNHYNLADSYLELLGGDHKQRKDRNFLNKLRVQLKINAIEDSLAIADKALKDVETNSQMHHAILVLIVETLASLGQYDASKNYLQKLENLKAQDFEATKNSMELLHIIQLLNSPSIKIQDSYTESWKSYIQKMYPFMLQKYSPTFIIDLLWKHGLYDSGFKFIDYLDKNEIYQRKSRATEDKMVREQSFLFSNIDKSSMLQAVSEYEAENSSNDEILLMSRFRKNLYALARDFIANRNLDFFSIANQNISDDEMLYQRLSIEERSLLFYLFVNNLEYDTDLLMQNSIDDLIEVEAELGSLWRAWQMSLVASERYLEMSDFAIALHFFKNLNKYNYTSNKAMPEKVRYTKLFAMLSANYSGMEFSRPDVLDSLPDFPKYDGLSLIHAVPLQFSNDEMNTFVKEINMALASQDKDHFQWVYNALVLAKQNAIKIKNWHGLLDLESLEDQIRNQQNQFGTSLAIQKIVYEAIAKNLMQKIPEKQTLLAVVPFRSGSYKITIRRNYIHGDLLPESGSRLYTLQYKYLKQKDSFRHEDLVSLQRTLHRFFMDSTNSTIYYYWLGHDFALAPINFFKNDRIYFITSLTNLATNAVLDSANESKNKTAFKLYEPKSACDFTKVSSLDNRIKSMEEHAIESSPDQSLGNHIHILQLMNECSLADILKSNELKVKADFFLSRVYFPKDPFLAHKMWYNLIRIIKEKPGSRGVVTLQLPEGINHAYMIREYYKQNQSDIRLERRFIDAYLEMLRNAIGSNLQAGQYRLLTNQFVQD